jgi:hypothetical protein
MPEDFPDRLTILERAQQLHDLTLRRHGEMLDRHEDQLVHLREIQERQERLMETLTALTDQQEGRLDALAAIAAQHEERMAKLQQTLDAIKNMLDRGNGRP